MLPECSRLRLKDWEEREGVTLAKMSRKDSVMLVLSVLLATTVVVGPVVFEKLQPKLSKVSLHKRRLA